MNIEIDLEIRELHSQSGTFIKGIKVFKIKRREISIVR